MGRVRKTLFKSESDNNCLEETNVDAMELQFMDDENFQHKQTTLMHIRISRKTILLALSRTHFLKMIQPKNVQINPMKCLAPMHNA